MSTEILNISDHRDAQSNIDKVDSIYSMLRAVEINPTELCNRGSPKPTNPTLLLKLICFKLVHKFFTVSTLIWLLVFG